MKERGFTVIEMLLSVSIIALLAGLSLPVYESFNNRNELEITSNNLANTLRRAQVYAKGGQADDAWGVSIQPGAITLFKGSVFATRDTAYDEVTVIAATTTVSGISEVVFTKLIGVPSTSGSVTLTNNTNETRTVNLNVKGVVSY